MEVGFYKDVYHEYMMIDKTDIETENSFEEQLLHNKEIPGLLRMKMEYMGEVCKYYYDIGHMESFENIKADKKLDEKIVTAIFENIRKLLPVLDNYLLMPESLWLEPDGIYKKRGGHEFYFAYVPGYVKDFKEQLKELLSWLMKSVDHSQKNTVMFIYGFYKMLSEDDSAAAALEKLECAGKQFEDAELPQEPVQQKQTVYRLSDVQKVSEQNDTAADIPKRPMTFVTADIGDESETEKMPDKRSFLYWFAGATALLLTGIVLKDTGERLIYRLTGVYISSWIIVAIFFSGAAAMTVLGIRILLRDKETAAKTHGGQQKNMREFWQESQRPDYSRLTAGETTILGSGLTNDMLILKRMEGDAFDNDIIYITSTPFVIGKQYDGVDYHLGDRGVSRRHLEIRKEGRRYEAVDLSSTNGTWLNGSKIEAGEAYEIKQGDVLKIANIPFAVHLKER